MVTSQTELKIFIKSGNVDHLKVVHQVLNCCAKFYVDLSSSNLRINIVDVAAGREEISLEGIVITPTIICRIEGREERFIGSFDEAQFERFISATGHSSGVTKDQCRPEPSPAICSTLLVKVSKKGAIADFNEACETVTGYRREEVLGRSLLDLLVPEEWRNEVLKRFENLDAPEVQLPHRNPWKTRTGDIRMIQWVCRTAQEPDGDTVVLGYGWPITTTGR